MERDTNNIGKRISYDETTVTLKDAKKNVLGTFPLKKILVSDIWKYRYKLACIDKQKVRKALFIIRSDDKYAISVIPKEISFTSIACSHLCNSCARCYASADNEHGCAKVLDRHFEALPGHYSLKNAIISSARLEKYPFITTGFETFGSQGSDVFVVLECKHFCNDTREQKEYNTEAAEKLYSAYLETKNKEIPPDRYVNRRKKINLPYHVHPYQ